MSIRIKIKKANVKQVKKLRKHCAKRRTVLVHKLVIGGTRENERGRVKNTHKYTESTVTG